MLYESCHALNSLAFVLAQDKSLPCLIYSVLSFFREFVETRLSCYQFLQFVMLQIIIFSFFTQILLTGLKIGLPQARRSGVPIHKLLL